MPQNFDFFGDLKKLWILFLGGGYKEVYLSLFNWGTQYPFWHVIQVIWCLYVVHRSYRRKGKTFLSLFIRFFVGGIMTFAGREIVNISVLNYSPIQEYKSTWISYIIIYLLYEFTPYELFFLIVNRFYHVLGLFQGINQMRFLVFILSTIPLTPRGITFTFLFPVIDLIAEIGWRRVVGGDPTPMSNLTTILRTEIISGILILLITKTSLTPYIGMHDVCIPALIASVVQGAWNASEILHEYDPNEAPVEEPAPQHDEKHKNIKTPRQAELKREQRKEMKEIKEGKALSKLKPKKL